MSRTVIPAAYAPTLDLYDTQAAIALIKSTFQEALAFALNLKRVSAPLFVEAATGLNDDLNGVERAVSFDIRETGTDAQVVHSLAKWKRMALHRYGFKPGEGLYTDMNAIRRDEELDNFHSLYVDQWDWEKVMRPDERNMDFLLGTVRRIVGAIGITRDVLNFRFPGVAPEIDREVAVVSTQELEDMYPDMTPRQREDEFVRTHRTTFLTQVGKRLKSGERHDGRAPDYDDWDMNGDILVWSDLFGRAVELSSMGIRVDSVALDRQLTESSHDERRTLTFHSMLLAGELPQTIGGGIGQSRLSMFLLNKAHIGEVQSSVWDAETIKACEDVGVVLL
jgi:aspartate--ammonia ligase